jgi:hypothetical protein
MLAHALFPQIPQGVIPVVVKEGKNLLQVPVFKRMNYSTQADAVGGVSCFSDTTLVVSPHAASS